MHLWQLWVGTEIKRVRTINKKRIVAIVVGLLIVILACMLILSLKQQFVYTLSDSEVHTEFEDVCNAVPKSMDWIPDENSIEYGVINNNGISECDTKISLESGEEYHRYVFLKQQVEEEGEYSLLVFDNFRKIPYCVDGQETDHCTVKLKYGDEIMVPVTVNGLADGYHNLIFIWLGEINRPMDKEALEEQFYAPMSNCMWVDLEVGAGEWQPECGTYAGEYFKGCSTVVNLQSQYGIDNKAEYIVEMKSDQDSLFATVGNTSEDQMAKKMLWVINDFEQVPIDDKNYCMYVEVPKDNFISQAIPVEKHLVELQSYQVFIMDLESKEIDCSERVVVK